MTATQPDAGMFDIISSAVAATLTPEFVEKQVTNRVEKLITDIIDSSMRQYGDFGKQIEAAVKSALEIRELKLPSYGALVTAVLEREVKAHAGALIDARLTEDMRELLSIAPAEIKLSKIAEDMLEALTGDDGDRWGKVITVIVSDTEYSSRWIYLDDKEHHPERDKYKCKYRLLLNKAGAISCAYLEDKKLDDIHAIGRAWGLGDKIRAWYAAGTVIVLDEDAVVTSSGDF